MSDHLGQITMLQVVDVGKIKTMSINFDPATGRVKKVVGKNGAGKSTALKTIEYALQGKKAIPGDVIRHGTYAEGEKAGEEISKAVIRLTTDAGYIIERVVRKNAKGEQVEGLKVIKEGEGTIPSAQTFLTSMLSQYRNPQDISDKTSKELFSLLMSSVQDKLVEFDKEIADKKAEASVTRRLIKNLGEVVAPEKELPEDIDDVEPLKEELNRLSIENTKSEGRIETLRSNLENEKKMIIEIDSSIEELESKIAKLNESKALKVELVEDKLPYAINCEMEDFTKNTAAIEELKEKIEASSGEIELVESWKNYNKKKADLDLYKKELDETAEKVSALEAKKKEALEEADLPISGLEVSSETQEIWYNGSLWENVEESTRLLKSLEMCIKTTPEGAPRIFTMHRGESIGKERQQLLSKMLYENDAYLLMEVMSDNIEGGDFVILEEDEIIENYVPALVEPKEEAIEEADVFGGLF